MVHPHPSIIKTNMTNKQKSLFSAHIPALDGVRGLAISIVLIYHFLIILPPSGDFEKALMHLVNFGALGVELFFVLSGFLITGILFDSKNRAGYFRNFYMRRFLRIFPLYYGVLCVIFGVLRWLPWFQGPVMDSLVHDQWWAWLYGVNVLSAMKGGAFPLYLSHFWTLAIEEHFYLLWPLFVYFFDRKKLAGVCCLMVVGSCLCRMALRAWGANDTAVYVLTPCRLDGLCLGALFALVSRSDALPAERMQWLRRLSYSLAAFGLFAIFATEMADASSFWGHVVFPPLRMLGASLTFGAILVFALTVPKSNWGYRFFNSKLLGLAGKYSYGLYVFHFFIASYFEQNNTFAWWLSWIPSRPAAICAQTLFGIIASFGVAVVSYQYFERYFLRLKDRVSLKT